MLSEVASNGALVGLGGIKRNQMRNKFQKMQNVEDILDVTDENFDPNDATKRPKGWATVKLRRVYLKEWNDRKDGLDEDAILSRRYQREQEAEQEMIQEMSVLGRIRKFERMAEKNKGVALFPKGVNTQQFVQKRSASEKSAALSTFIRAANQTLETLSERVAETLTEKSLVGDGDGRISPRVSKKSSIPSAPRIIDTGRGPRALRPTSVKPFTPTPVSVAFKDIKLRRVVQSVGDLDINPDTFDPTDPLRRPNGWADLRSHRVDELEAKDRSYGMDESIIQHMRTERLAAVRTSYLLFVFSILIIDNYIDTFVGGRTYDRRSDGDNTSISIRSK
jgi:hypothetical protein